MEGLSRSSIGELHVALPPVEEQSKLLEFIKREAGKLESLSAQSEQAVQLLKERRNTLIAAAVAGQIDVRNA